jgi:hypothetical protein
VYAVAVFIYFVSEIVIPVCSIERYSNYSAHLFGSLWGKSCSGKRVHSYYWMLNINHLPRLARVIGVTLSESSSPSRLGKTALGE